jgi:hypothetical protein
MQTQLENLSSEMVKLDEELITTKEQELDTI